MLPHHGKNDLEVCVLCFLCRGMGDKFRQWYGHISQLRSLVPSTIPVVALTATATTSTKSQIISSPAMQNCNVVSRHLTGRIFASPRYT